LIFAAIDPGMKGAVTIVDGDAVQIFDTPLKIVKDKKDYDIRAMSNIFKPYEGRSMSVLIEAVFSMTGQGVSSTFNFGRGKGIWEGVTWSCGFNVFMVSPQTWKKHFPDLVMSKDKTGVNGKELSKEELSTRKRLFKAAAKNKARELAARLYPRLSKMFEKVKDDGRAESLLMALYLQDKHQSGELDVR
jgi:crossover junction endodeoxyribonuclease RuvC